MNSTDLSNFENANDEKQPILASKPVNNFATRTRRASSWSTQISDDPEFARILDEAEEAIEKGALPVRISAGSSGSYFVRNIENKYIGVFKPKDEEPYGRHNPKWSKWLQKALCPCCFGRGCLVHNQGYLSEAGASIIDSKLRLNIVPKTRVVRLDGDPFYYPAYQRFLVTSKNRINDFFERFMSGKPIFEPQSLPSKIGSFQLFVENYVSSDTFLKKLEKESLPKEVAEKFQLEFEKLVILDYIIRNTDRNNDNWLVKYEIKENNEKARLLQSLSSENLRSEHQTSSNNDNDPVSSSTAKTSTSETNTTVDLRIAAIDNGLAFPFKHPDEWRAYPFHWAWLKQAKVPFSEKIKYEILPYLCDLNFVQHELCDELEKLFSQDSEYNARRVERQLSVMRGQILNLAQALRDGKSPFDLVHMPTVVVERGYSYDVSGRKKFKTKFYDRYPLFSWF